jgi:hypothetical protein
VLGYGGKQDEACLYNYTVAKAVMDCTFELDSPYMKWKRKPRRVFIIKSDMKRIMMKY